MYPRHHPTRRRVAIVTLWSLLISPVQNGLGLAAQQSTPAAKPSPAPKQTTTAAKPASASAAAAQPADGGWPRSYKTPGGGDMIIYQPQVASWENQKKMTLYAAVSYTAKAGAKPALGTVKADADTKVSVSERIVDFSVFRIVESNFPTLEKAQLQEVVAELTRGIPQEERIIAYPPYVHYGAFPVYYPFYPTYGYSAWYNPWTGTYGRGAAVYGPYGGAAVGQAYNARTGTYARGGVAYGPYGARGAAEAYNPRTGTYGATRQGSGVYGSWGQTGVQRGDQWATTSRVTNKVTGTTTRTGQTSEGGAAISRTGGAAGNSFAGKTGSGDVYAGHDGNVYKKDGDSWQKYDNGGWNNVQKPTTQQAQERAGQARDRATASGFGPSQLNRDSMARGEGAQRTRDYGSVRSGASARSGSYRPSGGSRGGGRRR